MDAASEAQAIVEINAMAQTSNKFVQVISTETRVS